MWYMVCVVYVVWCVIGIYVACVLCVWCVVWCVVYMAWYVCGVICDLCMFGVFVYMMGGCGAVCDTGVEAMPCVSGQKQEQGRGPCSQGKLRDRRGPQATSPPYLPSTQGPSRPTPFIYRPIGLEQRTEQQEGEKY